MQRIARTCAVTLLIAGCGGGGTDDDPPQAAQQVFRNCRYEYHDAGLLPAGYRYSCSIVGKCDMSDPCSDIVANYYPECQPGRTTCTPN